MNEAEFYNFSPVKITENDLRKLYETLSLDDLVCIYNCVDMELSHYHLSCIPDTARDYFNQLNRIVSHIHSVILEYAKNATIKK